MCQQLVVLGPCSLVLENKSDPDSLPGWANKMQINYFYYSTVTADLGAFFRISLAFLPIVMTAGYFDGVESGLA